MFGPTSTSQTSTHNPNKDIDQTQDQSADNTAKIWAANNK